MKVTAHKNYDGSGFPSVKMYCEPLFGAPSWRYAYWDGYEWLLSSGRPVSRAMRNAIDRLPFYWVSP